jgi:tRNA threonylcarbamoyladenosine biosynthesis protein TsaE
VATRALPPRLPTAPRVVDEAALREWGVSLGTALRSEPAVVALRGDLGAGKTTLAQAIALGAGVTEEVTSPTFALVHEYRRDPGRLFHIDLHRIQSAEDLTHIGWDEMVGGSAIVLIEWPERAERRLPTPRLDISLTEVSGKPAHRALGVTWTE